MKRPFLIFALALVLCGCRKDPEITIPQPDPEPVQVNLVATPGSWWKYEWYTVDSLGQATPNGTTDSMYVVGDSLINGNYYIHLSGTYLGSATNLYRRDSSGCIINQAGTILFNYNSEDTSQVTTNDFYSTWWRTVKPDQPYIVPAGSFDVYDRQGHYYNTDGTPFTACADTWIRHEYYADGIGVIASQEGYLSQVQSQCAYLERRLVEYFIAP